MKVTATHNVYTYDELPPDAQKRALEVLCNEAWESLDADMVAEDLAGYFAMLATGSDGTVLSRRELADKYGVRIFWSVSYSQSDHASIEGKLHRSDLPNLAWPEGVTYARVSNRNYGGSRVECVETDDEAYIEHGDLYDATQDMIDTLNGKLYRYARQQCEAYTSAEYVIETYNECHELSRRFTDEGEFAPTPFWTDDNGEGGN
jgi:hypothetical protein